EQIRDKGRYQTENKISPPGVYSGAFAKSPPHDRNLKKDKTCDRNRGDAYGYLKSDREQPKLIERGLKRKQLEIRYRIGVNKYAGQNEQRTQRQERVITEKGKYQDRDEFENAGYDQTPEDRTDLLAFLSAVKLTVFFKQNERAETEHKNNIRNERISKR